VNDFRHLPEGLEGEPCVGNAIDSKADWIVEHVINLVDDNFIPRQPPTPE
jgi:hypothetical protein